MHFEIFVEDISGKKLLEILVPKIICSSNSFDIHHYKGIGKIPNDLHSSPDPKKRLLLNKLPAILRAYGKGTNPKDLSIIVVVDCDKRNCRIFKQELISVLESWEKLADITLSRTAAKYLKSAAYPEIGKQKTEWAQRIGSYMDINNNASPSFNCFKQKLEELAKKRK